MCARDFSSSSPSSASSPSSEVTCLWRHVTFLDLSIEAELHAEALRASKGFVRGTCLHRRFISSPYDQERWYTTKALLRWALILQENLCGPPSNLNRVAWGIDSVTWPIVQVEISSYHIGLDNQSEELKVAHLQYNLVDRFCHQSRLKYLEITKRDCSSPACRHENRTLTNDFLITQIRNCLWDGLPAIMKTLQTAKTSNYVTWEYGEYNQCLCSSNWTTGKDPAYHSTRKFPSFLLVINQLTCQQGACVYALGIIWSINSRPRRVGILPKVL